MLDTGAFLRITEGGFTYLLAAGRTATIEHRNSDVLQKVGGMKSLQVAWYLSGNERIRVIRLGVLMQTGASDWEYAVLLSDGSQRVGFAAEHVHVVPEAERPRVQPFNPPGSVLPGGTVIAGVCLDTEPEHLVFDNSRLHGCLSRSGQV